MNRRGKRRFLVGATSVVGGIGGVAAATPFVMSFFPSERAKAAGAPVEVDIGKLEPGQKIDVEWRGKVVWVINRTKPMLATLPKLDPRLADPNSERARSSRRTARTSTARSRTRYLVDGRHLHAPRLLAHVPAGGRARRTSVPTGSAASSARATRSKFDLAGRVYTGVPAPTNLAGAAAQVRDRHARSSRSAKTASRRKGTTTMQKLLTWIDDRFPLTALWESQWGKYVAPKNFNFWYYFGSLAAFVLVIQIVTGIFLTMSYKPDATKAFESVEYIMRDVSWGWLIRYMHSTGASMFFVVVYLHMFRGLMYGSYRKPRELTWIFGCLIYLCLMAEAFFGYLLPWGQMSYWGAQVIVNLFSAVPIIGEDLGVWIRGDYTISDITLNRFFAFHVIAVPLVLLGLVAAHLMALHETGSNNPDGIEIKQQPKDPATGLPLDGIYSHPVLHGEGHRRRHRLPGRVLGDHVLRAGHGRLLPRGEQLHSGRSAEDARAHRARLVLHAVLRDAPRGAVVPRQPVLGRDRDGCRGLIFFAHAVARPRRGQVDPLSRRDCTRRGSRCSS